tara:strand:+ start:46 stop:714 length:669 start_codon:yes stop_codon:yes gene_type:complete
MSVSELQDYIREIIKQELEEASVTGALDGGEGPPKTPYAFYGGRKKDKEKKKRIAQAGGYMRVKESVNEEKKNSNNIYLRFTDAVQDFNDKCIKIADEVTKIKGDKTDGKILMNNVKKNLISLVKLMNSWNKGQQKNPGLTTEGKYHQYKNDESMTPKQKIGKSMREVRNSLNELSKLIDMNVKLKNELNVDSQSYWKNTHKALHKISERLVKLANKVGQLK